MSGLTQEQFWYLVKQIRWGNRVIEPHKIAESLRSFLDRRQAESFIDWFKVYQGRLWGALSNYGDETGVQFAETEEQLDDLCAHIVGLGKHTVAKVMSNPALALQITPRVSFSHAMPYHLQSEPKAYLQFKLGGFDMNDKRLFKQVVRLANTSPKMAKALLPVIESELKRRTATSLKYIAIYKGKRIEVEASSSFAAQQLAAKKFNATKKPWEVTVMLAEEDGKPVVHKPLFAASQEVARFEEGKPADPTDNMSKEDAKVWHEMHDKYKDKLKKDSALGRKGEKQYRFPEGLMTELQWVERYADRVEAVQVHWHSLINKKKWNSLEGGLQAEYEAQLKERAKKPVYRAWKGDTIQEISKDTYQRAQQKGLTSKKAAWAPPKSLKAVAALVAKKNERHFVADVITESITRKAGIVKAKQAISKAVAPTQMNQLVDAQGPIKEWVGKLSNAEVVTILKEVEKIHERGKSTQHTTTEDAWAKLTKEARTGKKAATPAVVPPDAVAFMGHLEMLLKQAFPHGVFAVSPRTSLGGSHRPNGIVINFATTPKHQWANGIVQNDPSYHTWWIHSAFTDEGLLPTLSLELSQGGKLYPSTLDERGQYRSNYGGGVKVGWRNKTGTPSQIIQHMKAYMTKLRAVYDANVQQ